MNLLDVFPITVATFSPMDMGIIFFVILIFFGAKKLPEFARSMGQAVREFSRAKDDFEREISRHPEPERPYSLEHSSETHEPVQNVVSEDVGNVADAAHSGRPEGTEPYEPASASRPAEENPHKA